MNIYTHIKEYCSLLRFIRYQKLSLALAAVCMVFSTLFDGISLGMLVPVLDRVLTPGKILVPRGLPSFLSMWVDVFNQMPRLDILRVIVIAIPVLILAKGVFNFLQNYFMNVVAQGAVRDVKSRIFEKLQSLSLDFYSKKRTGELVSRITHDVGLIAHAISFGLTDVILHTLQLVMFVYISLFLRWDLTFIALAAFSLFAWPVIAIGKRVKKFTTEIQQKMADLNTLLTETIQGAYIVKVFNRERYELQRFRDINQVYYKTNLSSLKRTLFLAPLTEFAGCIGAVLVIWVVGRDVINGVMSFGTFAMYLAALLQTIKPFKKLAAVHVLNQQAIAASSRIYDVLNEEPKVKETPEAKPVAGFIRDIVFEDVWFGYDADNDVLKGISLHVAKGQTIAFVGHSGAGKSTLVGLLPRLYDPVKGRVLLDGIDIRDIRLRDLRAQIGVVSQEMVLFNATVRDNIAYGKEGAAEEEIIQAAKKAYAYDFISGLPRGFDTFIGDRGFRLSGGERQRISIARAILKNAPILILDEATSSLDSKSEKIIQEAFYNLMSGGKTSFVIAHRLSTVQRADRIAVLDKGSIVEYGTHQQLLDAGKQYKQLYQMQFLARE